MVVVAFIGLGHMGQPMALNLLRAGFEVKAYDVVSEAVASLTQAGALAAESIAAACQEVDYVISMLPEGEHVKQVYLSSDGVLASAPDNALLIEASTIDITTARQVNQQAQQAGYSLIDAPVSGGTKGAREASLTFMVGGAEADFQRAQPLLQAMGKRIVHAGPAGNGQLAKICNNLMLGAHMAVTAEAFHLAKQWGMAPETLFEICNSASGQSWTLSHYCPVAGPLPDVPAAHDYEPGFMAKMMLKDLTLAQQAAQQVQASIPVGGAALSCFNLLCQLGYSEKDFSSIYELINGQIVSKKS